MGGIFTVGHSLHKQEEFFNLLKKNGITTLVDVRSVPFSSYAPQFNKGTIEKAAEAAGITYVNEAEAFGARRQDRTLYNKDGVLDFNKVRATPLFKMKVAEYMEKARKGENIVFMCTEKDPLACHRTIMVARGFALEGMEVGNILPDGNIMPQEKVDEKLLDKYFPGHGNGSLFPEFPEEENAKLVERAYAMQNAVVGYKLSDLDKQAVKSGEVRVWDNIDDRGGLLNTKDRVGSFRGEYGFLSNMHDCPVEYKGTVYKSSEAAYQAQRCEDPADMARFSNLSGVEAKALAKKVHTVGNWDSVKDLVMEEILSAKFRQNPSLADKLLATGDKLLAEGNHWRDTYWGVYNGRGQNVLGKLLMKVREELRLEREAGINNKSKDEFVVSVTGHRPHLMFGYDWKNDGNKALSARIGSVLRNTLEEAAKEGYTKFRVVTGMALGTDQMFAAHAVRLAGSDAFKGKLSVEAAVPFKGQENKWNEASKRIYNALLNSCDQVTVVSDGGFTPKAMQDRNEYMVDKADIVLSVYDGVSSGGTKNCIDYAREKGVPVRDIGLPELLKEYSRYQGKKSPLLKRNMNPEKERG